MMPDYPLGQTIDFKFTTRAFATGIPTVLAGTPVVEIYEDNSVTQITAAETLTVDFDSVVGLNNLRIVATSGNGFESGKSYAAIISVGTVGGVSVVGEVIAQFSIERAAALMPTTAGRTLDVTATGAAGIDWANVENKTTANDLSATDIQLADTVTTYTGNTVQTGDSFARIGATGSGLTSLAAASLFTGITKVAEWLGLIAGAQAADATALTEIKATGAGSGTYDESTDSQEAIAGAGGGGAPTAAQNADAVWDEARSGHVGAGSFGEYVLADAVRVSGDATAADNLELQYDATGLTGDTFPATQSQLGNLAVGSGGVSTTATSDSLVTTGTETLTYTETAQLDTSYHEVATAASAIEMYYQFAVGGNGVPQSVEWTGYVQSNGDALEVYFYNWAGTSWDQVGTISGANGTTAVTEQFTATTAHVGTGADIGKVRFRMASSGGDVATNLATDRILCTYAVVAQSVGYSLGRIWFDSVDGVDGSEVYVNGVADNPCKTYANVLSLMSALSIHEVNVSPESTFAPTGDLNNANVYGVGYTLTFGGHDYAGTHFFHASPVTGIATSANNADHLDVLDSIIGDVTVNDAHFTSCSFKENTLTFGAVSSTVRLINCRSVVAGAVTPIVDFGTGSANHNLTVAHWQNGIEIHNFNATSGGGTDLCSISGTGQLIIDASCDGGTINLRGQWKVTNNSGGAVTIVQDDVATSVTAIEVDTGTTIPTTLGTPADTDMATDLVNIKAKVDLLPEQPAKNAQFVYVIKMVDDTDHVTPKTGLSPAMTRSIDGAAFGSATGSVAEIATGHYKVTASAADMNGDVVTHRFTGTAADDLTIVIQTTA